MNIIKLKPIYKPTIVEEVEKYRDLSREIKRLTAVADKIKKSITENMGDKTEIHNENGHVIATYTSQESSYFSREEFKKLYPELSEKFTEVKTIKVFRLK